MAKLTSLLVAHGEKIVLGGIVVIALLVVGLATPWSWYPKFPGVVRAEVVENREFLEDSTWSEDEQARFVAAADVRELAKGVLEPMTVATIKYDDPFWWPVIPRDLPAGEPGWKPVKQLIADAGRAILALGPHPDTLEEIDLERAEAARLAALEQRPTTNLDGPTPRGANGLDPSGLSDPAAVDPLTGEPLGGEPLEFDPLTGEPIGVGGGIESNLSPDKYRPFVSIRGVFPLKEQLEAIRDALHVATLGQAFENLVFLDFELQRQQALDTPDPWSGEWEPVDIEVAKDILLRSTAFDFDEAKAGVSEDVFTMPLPGRLSGAWGPRATHPAFSEETVDKQRTEIEKWLTKKLLQWEKEHAEDMKEVERVLPGGFTTVQNGTGDVLRGAANNKKLLQDILAELQQDLPVGLDFQVTPQMVEQLLSQEQNELLFRFIDFDVKPANLYRYRVRLKVLNPNFNRAIDQIESPSVARGETRWTEWSEPTESVFVPADTRFFVADVDGRDDRFRPAATIPVYDWHADNGTPVRAAFRVEPGGAIGGTARTPLIDAAAGRTEPAEVDFDTGRLLVGVDAAPDRLDREHRELLGLNPRDFSLPEPILLVNRYGEFDVRGFDEQRADFLRAESTRREWLTAYPQGGTNPEEYLDEEFLIE